MISIEGHNLSWDELTCVGYEVNDEAVNKLCSDIKAYMLNSAETEEEKKECSGALYEQVEDAYKFVLKHINLSARIEEGLVRKEAYELPISAIREMIINAVCHRNYMDASCVQVAIYDDRVEVSSPGMLYGGITMEEIMAGRSSIRNRTIAEVFSRMEIVESWGTGIKRILERAKEYGLPEPEFWEIGDMFRVNLFRKADKKPIKVDREKIILDFVQEHGTISNKEAREILGLAESTRKRILKELVERDILKVEGNKRTRRYIIE